jgi:hypothetical protein
MSAFKVTALINMPSFPAAAIPGSLDVQVWIHALLSAGRMARRPPRTARRF